MIEQSKVVLFLLTISLPASDCAISFIGGEKNVTALKGVSSIALTWNYQDPNSVLDSVKWKTYIPRTSSNLKYLIKLKKNGDRDPSVIEPSSYQGRVSATKSGNSVSLVISNVKLDDSNSYICTLTSPVRSVHGPKIYLEVEDCAMSFIGGVKNITALKGALSISLTWNYQGTDQYFRGVRWFTYIPNNNVVDLMRIDQNGQRDTSISEPSSYQNRLSGTVTGNSASLVISNVKLDDSNTYLCRLTSVIQTVDGPVIHLEVGDPPSITLSSSQTCKRGDSQCTLTCSVSGTPQPTITWTRKDQTAVLSNLANYVISSVKTTDAGSYTCKAENIHGVKQGDINLVVQYFDFNTGSSSCSVKTWDGHETKLTCVASGEPTPTFDWWNPNRQLITQGTSTPQPGNSVLTFTPQQGSDYGRYTCRGKNDAGRMDHDIHVTEIFTPDKPSITNTEPAAHSITVTWTAPGNDGGSPVTKYSINVSLVGVSTWKPYDVDDPSLRTYSVSGLESNKEYRIRMSAWNIVGQGPDSAEKVTVKTLDQVHPPISSQLSCLSKNGYKVLLCTSSEDFQQVETHNVSSSVFRIQKKGEWKCRLKTTEVWSEWSDILNTKDCQDVEGQSCSGSTCCGALIAVSILLVLLFLFNIVVFLYLRYHKSPQFFNQQKQTNESTSPQEASSNQTSGLTNDTFYMELQSSQDDTSGQYQAAYTPVHLNPVSSGSSPTQIHTPRNYEPLRPSISQLNDSQRSVPNATYEPLKTVIKKPTPKTQPTEEGVYEISPTNVRI